MRQSTVIKLIAFVTLFAAGPVMAATEWTLSGIKGTGIGGYCQLGSIIPGSTLTGSIVQLSGGSTARMTMKLVLKDQLRSTRADLDCMYYSNPTSSVITVEIRANSLALTRDPATGYFTFTGEGTFTGSQQITGQNNTTFTRNVSGPAARIMLYTNPLKGGIVAFDLPNIIQTNVSRANVTYSVDPNITVKPTPVPTASPY